MQVREGEMCKASVAFQALMLGLRVKIGSGEWWMDKNHFLQIQKEGDDFPIKLNYTLKRFIEIVAQVITDDQLAEICRQINQQKNEKK
jgi:hypothetical protein